MTLKNIINIENISGNFNYYEFPNNKYEGSFLEIANNDNEIVITTDRFSSIPYYYIFKNKIYEVLHFRI